MATETMVSLSDSELVQESLAGNRDAFGRIVSRYQALISSLRYFEDRALPEVALALGLKKEAAKKRLLQALEKLRSLFAKRGLAISASGLAAAITANAVQAANCSTGAARHNDDDQPL